MKNPRTLRALVAALFVLLTALGLFAHTGWGTPSAFGIDAIAYLCPLGALEVLVAEKTFIPRVIIALVVVLAATLLLGRVFCGWVCPFPWVEKLLSKILPARSCARRAKRGSVFGPKGETTLKTSPNGSDTACGSRSSESACSTCAASGSDIASGAASTADAKPRPEHSKAPYAILGGALASSAVFGFPVFCLICPVGLTLALVIALWRLFVHNGADLSILWFAGVLLLEVFVLRRWCSSFCPIGALLTLVSRWNKTLRPEAGAHCVKTGAGVPCTRCRDACPEGIDPVNPTPEEAARCTKCGECASACLAGAIRFPWKASRRVVPIVSEAQTNSTARPIESVPAAPAVPDEAAVDFGHEYALCRHCGSCGTACPQGMPMPEILSLTARGNVEAARALLMAPGRFPEICARICPSEKLCESACRAESANADGRAGRSVAIARLEAELADEALRGGWRPRVRRSPKERSVAIVGSGPAGLACADVLARSGVAVTIYEREATAGGLLATGIPAFKLPRELTERRIALLESIGVRFILSTEVGRDVAWSTLLANHDAVFAATGAGPAAPLVLNGRSVSGDGIIDALAFLKARTEDGKAKPLDGLRIVVLGGGDTALDCARSSLLAGARTATVIARRPKEKLRARPIDLAHALAEGVTLCDAATVVSVERHPEGWRVALTDGRVLVCDRIVVAYGQKREADEELSDTGLRTAANGRGTEPIDGGTVPGLWAGGDLTRGATLVTTAIADGREAAERIARAIGIDIDL